MPTPTRFVYITEDRRMWRLSRKDLSKVACGADWRTIARPVAAVSNGAYWADLPKTLSHVKGEGYAYSVTDGVRVSPGREVNAAFAVWALSLGGE